MIFYQHRDTGIQGSIKENFIPKLLFDEKSQSKSLLLDFCSSGAVKSMGTGRINDG